jgi:hypothetical protein
LPRPVLNAAGATRGIGNPWRACGVPAGGRVMTEAEAVFHSSGMPGFSPEIRALPGAIPARKLERTVRARFAGTDAVVQTPEGAVRARAGDAIITGYAGEEWPVPRKSFEASYEPHGNVTMGEAGIYRRLPRDVLAARMQTPFAVVLVDGHSRLSGGAGDWLVDYGDGTLGVIADAIFLTTYETLP